MNAPGTKPSTRQDAQVVEFLDELVVYVENDERAHHLNGTAALIWRLCDGRHTLEEVEKEILLRFDSSPEIVHADLEEIIDTFRRLQLLAERAEPCDTASGT